jgi:septal ring factor EnvC (AmiA/AmiB activator)
MTIDDKIAALRAQQALLEAEIAEESRKEQEKKRLEEEERKKREETERKEREEAQRRTQEESGIVGTSRGKGKGPRRAHLGRVRCGEDTPCDRCVKAEVPCVGTTT